MANIPQLFPFLDSSVPKQCYNKWWIGMHICWIKSQVRVFMMKHVIFIQFPYVGLGVLEAFASKLSNFPLLGLPCVDNFRPYESAKKTSTKVQESESRSRTFRIFHRNLKPPNKLQLSFRKLIARNFALICCDGTGTTMYFWEAFYMFFWLNGRLQKHIYCTLETSLFQTDPF